MNYTAAPLTTTEPLLTEVLHPTMRTTITAPLKMALQYSEKNTTQACQQSNSVPGPPLIMLQILSAVVMYVTETASYPVFRQYTPIHSAVTLLPKTCLTQKERLRKRQRQKSRSGAGELRTCHNSAPQSSLTSVYSRCQAPSTSAHKF